MQKVSLELNVKENNKDFNSLLSIINRSSVLPILESVRIVNNGVLKLIATDLQNEITIEYPATSKDEFDICLEGSTIKSFMKNSISDTISIIGDDIKVKIKQDDFTVTTVVDKSENFPKSPVIEDFKSITINSKLFSELMTQALPFVSNDDLRPAMTGINLRDWKGYLYVVSTDANRLFYRPVMVTPDELKGLSVIIPYKAAKSICSMFKGEDIEIKISSMHIGVSGANKNITSRLIQAKYPEIDGVIVSPDLKFSLIRKQLNSFLLLAKNFVNPYTKQLILEVEGGNISFAGGDNHDGYDFEYKLPIYNESRSFSKFRFGVNLRFLTEALSVNKKDEYVIIEHTTENIKAFLIDECMLMMPLIINEKLY